MEFFAERRLQELPEFEPIFKQHPDLQWIDDYQAFRRSTIVREKQCVLFAQKRGAWIKPFHCYAHPRYRYFTIDVAEGCVFDCVYCYLQSYLNHGALVLFVDVGNLQREFSQFQNKNAWFSTGLLSDSLVSEKFLPILPAISHFLPSDSILELRSKSGDVSSLENPDIRRGPVVISWSMNPPEVAGLYEFRAAPPIDRFKAARKAIELGYRIAFHFDPLFHFAGWELAYQELLEELDQFSTKDVAFLSVGLFRYMPDLGAVIRQRFPFHPVMSGEFFMDQDGKYHYLRGIRSQMYSAFRSWLSRWQLEVPVLWSMEPDARLVGGVHK
jgi:spore photoproduct lyase